MVVTQPQGKGEHRVLDVVTVDYNGQTITNRATGTVGEPIGVLMQDLSIIHEVKPKSRKGN